MAEMAHASFARLLAIVKCEDVVRVPVGRSKFALVDAADFDLVKSHKWLFISRYAATRIDGALVMMHRLIMSAPDGRFVDHEDGDGLNNQRYNLRICSHTENMRNRCSVSGLSRFKGVHHSRGAWRASIAVNKQRKHLGVFSTQKAAAKAYDRAAKKYFGEFAKTNADLNLY